MIGREIWELRTTQHGYEKEMESVTRKGHSFITV